MTIKNDLGNYTYQARSLLRKYGDSWMWNNAECEGELAYWLMYADNRYDPTKGASEGTWRIFIAKCRIGSMRRVRRRHARNPCFTDIGEDYEKQVRSLEEPTPLHKLIQDSDTVGLDEIRARCDLTKKQLAVFDLLAQGYNQVEIAKKMGVSKQAISLRKLKMLKKLRQRFCKDAAGKRQAL